MRRPIVIRLAMKEIGRGYIGIRPRRLYLCWWLIYFPKRRRGTA